MELNNIIFSFLVILIGFFFTNYCLLNLQKNKLKLLADDQFRKPQAFHQHTTFRLGGIIFFLLLNLVLLYLYFFKNIFYLEYLSFSALFFFLGLLDDLKINIPPKFRLLMMIFSLIFLVSLNNIYITKTGLEFLDHLVEIDIFALVFICLCFLFIINGSNLIDGFNGLLGFHSLIIFIVLFFINFFNENSYLSYILFFIIILNLIFLKFNFPKAQIFLGDSGAYLIGSLIAISAIQTSNFYPSISPFFFCILLFYLFFEVFFSFFRKIFFAKQSPLLPDNRHLHMSIYKYVLKKNKIKSASNYRVSVYINLAYLLLLIPAIIFMNDGLFCRYYFFSLLIFYTYFYRMIYKKIK